ncbi:PREDICTED: uncharacterized protein LOC109356861 isoform X2 [Lupinus angustifolius]|uniref:uncharacterized protein LOC109356861 isoform X2 n=1 Tax=Lupinus angustifolius TaxID=3871 RepID=UPI00092F6FFF|nr:PREDICTED: uncharacterized protein LOC109356861 isoform X2 [Lupinus angustifolius]
MGQIVRRKKKGRPSKADLARRSGESPASAQSDLRRSRRRRNVRYTNMIDYDDYLDEEEEDEDERRREKKKLKLVMKLNQGAEEDEEEQQEGEDNEHHDYNNNNSASNLTRMGTRDAHAPEEEEEQGEDELEEEEEEGNGIDAEENEEEEEEGGEEDEDQRKREVKGTKVDSKWLHSVSGTPSKLLPSGSGIPLPDKRTLELILDKLQKKDTYGVYAEPVDPEELPDYHDVVDHPMDFATVRNKLANGSYPTLEQFESDIFLICSNAMQYNSPETIYHKQVGLQAEYSYARSLARFAATLGPTAWEIASQKIQQALPPGCKFGRGWVGEYEPLPTPVLMFDNFVQKEPNLVKKLQSTTESIKVDKNSKNVEPTIQQPVNGSMVEGKQPSVHPGSWPTLEGKPSLFGSVGVRPNTPVNLPHQQPNVQTRNLGKSKNKGLKQVELNSLPPTDQNNVSLVVKLTSNAPASVSKPREMVPCNTNISPSMPFKQPDINGVVSGDLPNGKVRNTTMNRRMPGPSESSSNQTGRAAPFFAHGQPSHESTTNQIGRAAAIVSHGQPSPESTSNQTGRATPFFAHRQPSPESTSNQTGRAVHFVSHGQPSPENTLNQTGRAAPFVAHGQEQSLSDPVQLMRILAEKAQKQQQTSSSSNHSPVDTPPGVPSGQRDGTGNASAAAARAWMSVGAGGFKQGPESPSPNSPKNQISADSLYNPVREFHQHMSRIRGEFPSSGMSFQSDKNNFPFQALAHQPMHPVGASQFQNRPNVFPQVAAPSDLSRFQMQPPWQGIRPPSQPRQKQETLPPDLNIGFQSPGSPVKQSSGVMVDSQQPDLALQL